MKELINDAALAMIAAVVVDWMRREHGKWVQRRLDRQYENMKEPKSKG